VRFLYFNFWLILSRDSWIISIYLKKSLRRSTSKLSIPSLTTEWKIHSLLIPRNDDCRRDFNTGKILDMLTVWRKNLCLTPILTKRLIRRTWNGTLQNGDAIWTRFYWYQNLKTNASAVHRTYKKAFADIIIPNDRYNTVAIDVQPINQKNSIIYCNFITLQFEETIPIVSEVISVSIQSIRLNFHCRVINKHDKSA
jgi:hypothetical protein